MQLECASAKLAESLIQMRTLVASVASLTDRLSASERQGQAEHSRSEQLACQLSSSQAECRQA